MYIGVNELMIHPCTQDLTKCNLMLHDKIKENRHISFVKVATCTMYRSNKNYIFCFVMVIRVQFILNSEIVEYI